MLRPAQYTQTEKGIFLISFENKMFSIAHTIFEYTYIYNLKFS